MERWSILILPGDGPKTKKIRTRKKKGRSGSKERKELTIQQSAVTVIVNLGHGYKIFCSVERLGAATFYFVDAMDAAGVWLDGGADYKLTVPTDVPAKQFWSVIVHDVETAAWFTDLPINKEGVASFTKGLEKNKDGSVDVYFGPKAPQGKETNWLPTVPGKKFFLIFRFYRPESPLFNKSWKLNDVEKLK